MYPKSNNINFVSSEINIFELLLYIAWACFRNDAFHMYGIVRSDTVTK